MFGTYRMDAAIAAMAPLGFTEVVVVSKMRELLKEYGGMYGFIELDGYHVLLESLLADQEKGKNQEQIAQGETSKNEKVEEDHAIWPETGFIDIPSCSSSPLTIPSPQQPPILDAVLPLPPPPVSGEAVLPLPPPPAVPPAENAQAIRRKACHGWIGDDDDDEEWHFITLPPSSINQPISSPEAQPKLTGARKNRTRRQSRWDLMPEDMRFHPHSDTTTGAQPSRPKRNTRRPARYRD